MIKITKLVSNIVLGRGCIRELKAFAGELLPDRSGYDVFIVDSVHRNTGTWDQLTPDSGDLMMAVDVSAHEPKTEQVDELCGRIREEKGDTLPRVVIGIGGGSAMDTAKAVSVMLTNPGSSADYQGWDRVKEKAVPKIAVPTLAGTGAEASRTAVLSGPVRKLGINSEQSMFNGVLMDPDLLESADPEQAFPSTPEWTASSTRWRRSTGAPSMQWGGRLPRNPKRRFSAFSAAREAPKS
jgi:3-deoxy-alpha-D-manno-octulosonate 8-oxidase